MILSPDMQDLIRFLERHGVEYAVVGGLAVIYYGYVRTTQDIDILINPTQENALKMVRVLEEFGFGPSDDFAEHFAKRGTAIHLGVEPNRIDLLTTLQDVDLEGVFSRTQRIEYEGVELSIIAISDLLECKRRSQRLKDLADVEELEKIHSDAG